MEAFSREPSAKHPHALAQNSSTDQNQDFAQRVILNLVGLKMHHLEFTKKNMKLAFVFEAKGFSNSSKNTKEFFQFQKLVLQVTMKNVAKGS